MKKFKNYKVFKNYKIFIDGKFADDKVLVTSETIEEIMDIDNLSNLIAQEDEEGFELLDGNGDYLMPGFIDIHIHGAGGNDVMDGNSQALQNIAGSITMSGVVGFLATTMTMEDSIIKKALNSVRNYICTENKSLGAEILGVHLEGPFINPAKKGAQDPTFIQKPDIKLIDEYKDIIKLVTYAPEMDEDFKFTKEVISRGIQLSIGHSNSDYETCKCAYHLGVKNMTHCFNGMKGFDHREPGVVGAALMMDFNTEIIPDLVHTHKDVLGLLYKIKSNEHINIITDSIRANYLNEGTYDLGGQEVTVKDGKATLKDGTIAGSVLRLDGGVRNFVDSTGLSLEEVIPMVTSTPAKTIGEYDLLGSIDKGKKASLVIMDKDLNIIETIVKGKTVFKKEI